MKRSTVSKLVGGLAASGLLAALLFFTPVRSAVIFVIQRIESAVSSAAIGLMSRVGGGNTEQLIKQNEESQQKIADLLFQNAQLQKFETENEELQKLLNYRKHFQYESVVGKVIGKDPLLQNTLVIDQGSVEGVGVGQAVTVNDGIFIGTIVAVHAHKSTLLLITDGGVKVPAALADQNQVIGVAQGEYGLSLYVDLIPQALQLKEKDVIVTAPLQSLIPQGLVIGTVNRLISHENDLFKKVSLTPPVDYTAIQFVSIIKPTL